LEGSYINQPYWGSIWQTVTSSEEPLSVMLHLYGQNDSPEVGDGLGYQPNQWMPGDIYIQFNDFGEISGDYLETGLYNFQNNKRYLFEAEQGEQTSVRLYPPTTQ